MGNSKRHSSAIRITQARTTHARGESRVPDKAKDSVFTLPAILAITSLNSALTRALDREGALIALLKSLGLVLPFDSAYVLLPHNSSSFQLLVPHQRGLPLRLSPEAPCRVSFADFPLLRDVIARTEPTRLADAAQTPGWQVLLPDVEVHSWMAIPLVAPGVTLGICALASPQVDLFTQEHAELGEALALPAALALRNIDLGDRVRDLRARVRDLTQRYHKAKEDERKEISRELHDETGQSLTALTINLELLNQDLSGHSQELINRARESLAMTRQTMQRMGDLASQLRPPALDALGLHGALEEWCATFSRRTILPITYTGVPLPPLTDAASLCLYRFAQEALTNVVKHAEANRADVRLELTEREIRLSVQDNGKGFHAGETLSRPRRSGRLGLVGIRERLRALQGSLEIESHPGEGALLSAHVPRRTALA